MQKIIINEPPVSVFTLSWLFLFSQKLKRRMGGVK